jgi:hypothetical protein
MKKLLSFLGLTVGACGGGGESEGDFESVAEDVAGIYSLDEYTRNDQACTPGGESAAGEHTFAVAFTQKFLGTSLLSILSCESPADCRARVTGQGGFVDFSFGVEAVGDDGALTGGGASTGFGQEGTCTGGEVFATVLTLIEGQLRIEKAITLADDYPADDGFCTTDGARDAAAGNTCSSMEVLTATFVEEL